MLHAFGLVLLAFPFAAHASQSVTEVFRSTAVGKNSQVIYRELHRAEFGPGRRILSAKTEYLRDNGEKIAEMKSGFALSVTSPEYEYKDLRDGSVHGLRREDGDYLLYRQDKGKPRQDKRIKKSYFKDGVLVVGCQGLHYYLIGNLETIRQKRHIPIKYLIPGKLDYYSFHLHFDREDDQYVHLRVNIDNLVLRMFTSDLKMTYDKKTNRLVRYSGLSNIPDDKGDMQNVTIDYRYEETAVSN
jgi:hypothetical protein